MTASKMHWLYMIIFYQTGNDVLDLVLTEKGLLCDEYGIKMTCMIDALILGFMSVSDMNALFET